MMRMNDAAIHLDHVYFSIDGKSILKNITGSFPKEKITALVGPSGAGKSTLFRLLNGLRTPDKGEIYIHGKRITEYNPIELRRNVGLALQNAPMIDGTVFDNLALPLTLQGKQLSEKEAIYMLELVGLEEEFLQHEADELSGGQRQKVSIARTLINRPQILLLDEITSALDRVSQQEIEELIMRINEKYNPTILWITHNLQQAKKVAQFVWVMMDGEVVEMGDISILDAPTSDRVLQFVKGEVN